MSGCWIDVVRFTVTISSIRFALFRRRLFTPGEHISESLDCATSAAMIRIPTNFVAGLLLRQSSRCSLVLLHSEHPCHVGSSAQTPPSPAKHLESTMTWDGLEPYAEYMLLAECLRENGVCEFGQLEKSPFQSTTDWYSGHQAT